ncbi:MAG: cobalamin synthesis protein P47K [Kiritimatiellaeota bacterium]|nr:cobalamin synthesis protein P47K [Kiritimatiellota bacterium]
MDTRIILAGGFLGAGKTTLLLEAAKRLASRGKRAGLVTNDQAPELVDTALLRAAGSKVEEVSGSCFCCNFPGFAAALQSLATDADVVLAEPVGSCVDLSATILQPLKDGKAGAFSVAPLSVLADPKRLQDILEGGNAGLHESSAYIYRKQLEEADFIVLTKADAWQGPPLATRTQTAFPNAKVFTVSSRTGEGMDAWLDAVMTQNGAGRTVLREVDYDVYAEGEAVLGWLNATYELTSETAQDWRAFAEQLLDGLGCAFDAANAAVGHVKGVVSSGGSLVAANLTGARETLETRGAAMTGKAATLTLNARTQMAPAELEAVVNARMAGACGGGITARPVAWRCLSPGYPRPTHRYEKAT